MKNILDERPSHDLSGRLLASVQFVEDIDLKDRDVLDIGCGYGWCELNFLGRGVKKDFWDLCELLKIYSLKDIISWHKEKYPSQMLLISIPNAITFFCKNVFTLSHVSPFKLCGSGLSSASTT